MQRRDFFSFRWKASLLTSVFIAVQLCGSVAGAGVIKKAWKTDGTINEMVLDSDGKLYLGGNFTYIGDYLGTSITVDATTAAAQPVLATVNGPVSVIEPDGSGGWFIGGNFTDVAQISRTGIAHILSDGSLDEDWNPRISISSTGIEALAVSGDTLYIGGMFSDVDGVSRSNAAAVRISDASLLEWNPNASDDVFDIAISTSTVFIGGSFTSVGGVSHSRIAEVDAMTGVPTTWNAGTINGSVNVIRFRDSSVLLGGVFTTFNGSSRTRLAEVQRFATGTLSSWNPGASNFINDIVVSTSTIYIGGNFTTAGGQSRNRLAEIDLSTGLASSWNPNVNGTVESIFSDGSNLVIAGNFTTVSGDSRDRVAQVSFSSASATAWSMVAKTISVNNIKKIGSQYVLGGGSANTDSFVTSWTDRNRLAAIDTSTNVVTSWNPNVNAVINDLVLSTSTVYIGGGFATVGGDARSRLAEVSKTTASATAWDPNANNTVNALALSGSVLYAGGTFTAVGNTARSRLAAIDLSSASPTSWNPNMGSTVDKIMVSSTSVYVGGTFTTVGPDTRNRIAEIGMFSASATAWDPNASASVSGITITDSLAYLSGSFTTIGGFSRSRLAAVDLTTGLPTAWDPSALSSAEIIRPKGLAIFVAGAFTSLEGVSQLSIGAVDPTTGDLMRWYPSITSANAQTVRQVTSLGETVYIAGNLGLVQAYTPQIGFTVTSSTESETSDPTLTLQLTEPVSQDVTVNFSVAGTASAGSDYTLPTSKVIPTGSTSLSFSLAILNEGAVEEAETVSLIISSVSPAYVTINTATTTHTLIDSGVIVSSGGGGSGHPGTVGLPPPVTSFQSTAPFPASEVPPVHTLLKLIDDQNPETQNDSAVYYIGMDGKRHAFPNQQVYFSWYLHFGGIQIVDADRLAKIPLGKNITYRPGTRLVKFTTNPKVYAVTKGQVLRWVMTEELAMTLYGGEWNTRIDDISDAFYNDYQFGEPIDDPSDYSPAAETASAYLPSDSF